MVVATSDQDKSGVTSEVVRAQSLKECDCLYLGEGFFMSRFLITKDNNTILFHDSSGLKQSQAGK